VVAHGFVDVHGLQDGRVEAGQQFGGDDEDLQRVVGVAVAVEQFFFGVAVAFQGAVALVVALLARDRDDDVAGFRRQVLIQLGFVEQARVLVEGDEHGFEAVGAHFFEVVAGHVGANGLLQQVNSPGFA
jgi:hypothetical protein